MLDEVGAPDALGDALLLRRRRLRPRVPGPRGLPLLRRHGHLQERRAAARGAPGRPRWTGSWWRPTRRTSPRCRTAAAPTPPTWCRSPCARWRQTRASACRSCAGRSRPTPTPPSAAPGVATDACETAHSARPSSSCLQFANSQLLCLGSRAVGRERDVTTRRAPSGEPHRRPQRGRLRPGAVTRGSEKAIIGESCAPQTRTPSFLDSSTTSFFSAASSARSWSPSAAPPPPTWRSAAPSPLSVDGTETTGPHLRRQRR